MAEEFDASTQDERTTDEGSARIAASGGRELDRLPPPAFPPGTRRGPVARSTPSASDRTASSDGGFPEGALISPDEPVRRIGDGLPDGALISPDDPIPPSSTKSDRSMGDDEAEQNGGYDVEVTGIGESHGNAYAPHPEIRDPERVAKLLEELAGHLRESGPADLLRVDGGSRLESALRGVVAGYLLDLDD